MTELQVKTKKGSLKKFFAMFLAVCVCLTTIQVNAATHNPDAKASVKLSTDKMTMTVGEQNKKLTASGKKVVKGAEVDPYVSGDGTLEVSSDGTHYVSGGDGTVETKGTVEVDAAAADIKWTSSNPAIVEVPATGSEVTLNAKKDGKATITVKIGDAEKTCVVTVDKKQESAKNPTKVTLNKTALVLDLNGTKKEDLKATVEPAGADQKVTWQSSDPSIATVANGTVTAVKVGKTTITATVPGTKLTATCAVEVKDSTPAKDNNTNKPNKTVKVKKVVASAKTVYVVAGKKVTLGATVEPANATNKKITWSTAKKSVASVKAAKNGASVTITAGKKAAGKKTTVTAKASGKSAKVTVNVVKKAKKATSVKLSKKTAKMNTGDKLALTATLNKGATSTIKWSVSKNKGVATVKNGVVTAGKNAGVVTITAKADKKSAKCVITVTKKGAKVTLNPTKKTIKVKKSFTIKLKKKASGDAIKSCTSSNKKVATVTNKGKVTGKKAGKADITVITKKGAVATCKVTVKK